MTPAGFPHSEICGSTPACDSPQLFAANHVLHRLLTPRHSPCALSSLTTNLLWVPGEALVPSRSDPRILLADVLSKIGELLCLRPFRAFGFGGSRLDWASRARFLRTVRPQMTPLFVHSRDTPSMKLPFRDRAFRLSPGTDVEIEAQLMSSSLFSNDARSFSQDTLSRRRFYSVIRDHGSVRPSTKDRISWDESELSSSFEGIASDLLVGGA
jgi:hypothetical protein